MQSSSKVPTGLGRGTPLSHAPGDTDSQSGVLSRLGLRFTAWAERWFPDAYVFAALAVVVVACAAMVNGSSPQAVAKATAKKPRDPVLHGQASILRQRQTCRYTHQQQRQIEPERPRILYALHSAF